MSRQAFHPAIPYTPQHGFTLIELLAVVVITAVMSVVSVSVFLNAQIRGNRSRSVSTVSQQGGFLLDHLNYLIRNAKNVVPCESAMESLQLETQDRTQIILTLTPEAVLASDGAALSSPVVRVSNLQFTCQQSPGQTGALVEYAFTLSTGDITTSPDLRFSQDFTSQVSLRSY